MDHPQAAAIEYLSKHHAVHIGVDIGQKVDYTAVVVAEVGERPCGQVVHYDGTKHLDYESTYKVRDMTRLPLGTPFVGVAQAVVRAASRIWDIEAEIRQAQDLTPYEHALYCEIFVDATGVGAPVYELIKSAVYTEPKADRANVRAITFTHGDQIKRGVSLDGEADSVGKAHLVSRLQVLFEQGRIVLPKGSAIIDAMLEELTVYEIRITPDANDLYGAFAVGAHDDLVTALGLACLEEPGVIEIGLNLWGGG
jgi:hypothetical protein